MRTQAAPIFVSLALLAGGEACAIKREQVRSLPVGDPVSPGVHGPRILVESFLDRRGEDASRTLGTTFVPVVNLFHMGETNLVPEQSATMLSAAHGATTQITGSLGHDLPVLLTRLLPAAVSIEDVEPGPPRPFDYHITGTIERSAVTVQINAIPGSVLAFLGVPFVYTDIELSWTLAVFRCGDLARPVLEKTYDFADSRVSGAYYNYAPGRAVFVAALKQTLGEARQDIEAAIAAHGPCPEAVGEPPEPEAPGGSSATKAPTAWR